MFRNFIFIWLEKCIICIPPPCGDDSVAEFSCVVYYLVTIYTLHIALFSHENKLLYFPRKCLVSIYVIFASFITIN